MAISFCAILAGCQTLGNSDLTFGNTVAENLAGYTYVPVEPFRVKLQNSCNCTPENKKITKDQLLNALPDNAIRIATRQISGSSDTDLSVVGFNTGIKGNSYEVIIDYVTTDTINTTFLAYWQPFKRDKYGKISERKNGIKQFIDFPKNTVKPKPIGDDYGTIWQLVIYGRASENGGFIGLSDQQYLERIVDDYKKQGEKKETFSPEVSKSEHRKSNAFNVPVYVGVGLRLKANVTVLKGEVHFTGLNAITTAVENGKATGSLSVQTIGVTGASPRTSLQLISKIDDTTILSAISNLSAIKASIEGKSTSISPRIVGFHNTAGLDAHGINRIHSLLAEGHLTLDLKELSAVTGATSSGE